MATWSIHYRTRSLGSTSVAKFSVRPEVKSRQFWGFLATQACASQQQPVDGYQHFEKRSKLRKQSGWNEDSPQVDAADEHPLSDLVSFYISVHVTPAHVSSSRSSRLHRNFSTFASAVKVIGFGRRPKMPLAIILTVALATAATSMMFRMAMVARPPDIFPAAPSELPSLLLHHPLTPIRTEVCEGHRPRRYLGVSSLAQTTSDRPDRDDDLDRTPVHTEEHPLRQIEAWQLAHLNVEFIDLTVTRAAAYDSAFQIPDPRRWGCWVSDQAGVMSGHAVEHINALLNALRHDTGTEVTVVTIEGIGNTSLSSKAFAEKLFNYWKMDKESDGNAILFLLVRSQGKVEVEVGRALEKTLRQAYLWGPDNGWLEGLTSSKAWTLLCKGEHGNSLMVAVENLADRVWEAAGLSRYQPTTGSSWLHRIRLLDMAWLTVPILFLCGNCRLPASGELVHSEGSRTRCSFTGLWTL